MICYEGRGDLFRSGRQTVICPVNTVGVMGKGLALLFAKRFPSLVPAYQQACRSGELAIGRVWNYQFGGLNILCFPSKAHWRQPSTVQYIESALIDLVNRHEELGIEDLAMVPVGCGLGELYYPTDVAPMLHYFLDRVPFEVDILHG